MLIRSVELNLLMERNLNMQRYWSMMMIVMMVMASYCFPRVLLAEEAQPRMLRGKVEAVTVYRGQAMVTRMIDLPGPSGLHELVVTDLPDQILPGSLYAESEQAEVRSVRYRVRPVERDVREEVSDLDDQIQALQDQMAGVNQQLQLIKDRREYLTRLETFTADTGRMELSKGVLDADTLKDMTLFLFDQRSTMAESELTLKHEQRRINQQIELLQRQRTQITGAASRTAREAVVFVNVRDDGGAVIRLRYLVNQATWSPSYNVRQNGQGEEISLEYIASVRQMTGENWDDVHMVLSTATPSLIATPPKLDPLAIRLVPAGQGEDLIARYGNNGYEEAQWNLRQMRVQAEQDRQRNQQAQQPGAAVGGNGKAGNAVLDARLNTFAISDQMLDLTARNVTLRRPTSVRPPQRPQQEDISVTYELANRTSLPSRRDHQLIQIASLPLPATLTKVSSPVLTSFVYDHAQVLNNSSLVLLAGPVATYVGGQFVGHGEIPMVPSGQTFDVGLGIDTSLSGHRELVERVESTQGGNRVVSFTYRLTLENYGDQPATVRLLDRLPHAEGSDIKVSLIDSDPNLSSDETYLRTDRHKGILRWDVQVPARAVGSDVLAVEYTFSVEHDRQMQIMAADSGGG